MGIPFYFREIAAKNRNILVPIQRCDRLSLDFNSVIHQSSQKVIQSKVWQNIVRMEEAIFAAIFADTQEIIQSCPPSQALYLAIDGIAPLAKISQQRKRRHLSALTNTLINGYKEKNGIPYTQWDSNCITPGTEFMSRLSAYLKSKFVDMPFAVKISGPDEPGEGEHKIIQYICDKDPSEVDAIYGMDADLIMLSMTCEKPNIYLMRDKDFVSIDILKTSIPCIKDYIVMCFLLGNDFLPHFLALDLKYEGLDILQDVSIKDLVTSDGKINSVALFSLFEKLAVKEESLIRKNIETYMQTPYVEKPHPSPLDRFIYELNFQPLATKRCILDMDDPFWKTTYYKFFMNVSYNDVAQVDKVCENFLQGLTWNLDYYLNNHTTNAWYYKYTAAPLITDLVRYMNKTATFPVPDPANEIELTPDQQLLLVLPYQSKHLLPCYEPRFYHMYPVAFKLKTFMKTQFWESIPILPPLDIKCVLSFHKS